MNKLFTQVFQLLDNPHDPKINMYKSIVGEGIKRVGPVRWHATWCPFHQNVKCHVELNVQLGHF